MITAGPDKNCEYYPCHEGMEDCTFCYCPFYPCMDFEKGCYCLNRKTGEKIWDCSGCLWIHKKSTVLGICGFLGQNRRVLFEKLR